MSTLARMLGPTLVKSVALTGSDPSFPLGTDVAVLFETDQPAVLAKAARARIAMAAAEAKAKFENDSVDSIPYVAYLTPDRKMSSYVAPIGDNADRRHQLALPTRAPCRGQERQIEVARRVARIQVLPQALSPQRRGGIGLGLPQRRDDPPLVRAAVADRRRPPHPRPRRAGRVAGLAAKAARRAQAEAGPIHTDLPILGGGELRLTPDGVVSSVYGTLDFMTPIGEMPLDEVTQDEAAGLCRWRDGYQRNWSWGFDPIGLRIGIGKEKLAADLSIMPLIMNSEYSRFFEISRGAKFGPVAGDPHKALAQFVFALNRDSILFRQGEGILAMAAAGQKFALGWIGPSITVYADDDPFWAELAKVDPDKLTDFMTKNLGRLPVGVRIESRNPLQLAAFLATTRGYIEQTGPGLTRWDSLKYKEQGYVRISPVKGQGGVPSEVENMAIYYTTVGGGLTITLSERVLQHASTARVAKMEAKPGDRRERLRRQPRRSRTRSQRLRASGSAPMSLCTSTPASWRSPTPWAASSTRTACRS